MPEKTDKNSAMTITTQALCVQVLTSAASLAFSMILSFSALCAKSGGNPLNRAIHPGIQSLNYRRLGSLGFPQGASWGWRRATASLASWHFGPALELLLKSLLRSGRFSAIVC